MARLRMTHLSKAWVDEARMPHLLDGGRGRYEAEGALLFQGINFMEMGILAHTVSP